MHKLRSTSHKFADYDDDQIAEEFFHVNKSSKGIIQSIPPLNRLISKTMSRPRDVVVFLNQILADKKIVSGDKITTDVVKKYEASASNYLENELISEMAAHFPNDNLLNSSMSVLRNIKQREFTGKKIFDAFIESGIEEESAKVSLQLLLQFCIIGKFKVNESPGFQMKSGDDKSRKIHKKNRMYDFQHYSPTVLNFEIMSSYVIHEGLRKSFMID